MEFLYPKSDVVTHKIKINSNISLEYPTVAQYFTSKDIDLGPTEVSVCLIRENIGYKCEWSYVKIIDNTSSLSKYYNNLVYVPSNQLQNIGGKESYNAICSEFNQIDTNAESLNPLFQEIFIPYVDKFNGFFSVRVQIDYDRIVDMKLFEKVLNEVYLEGVNILLASRGLRSDNATINTLRNKYYCFAYINNDLDQTIRRPCEPLTFTVSIPLNFFNGEQEVRKETGNDLATQYITFSNKEFVSTIDLLISLFYNKTKAVEDLKFPNKEIENFLISIEINSLRAFAVAANEIMSIAEASINSTDQNTTFYRIGLDNNLNIVSTNIKKYNIENTLVEEIDFAQGLLSQARLRGEFNNKRIFYWFLNLQNMLTEYDSVELLEFLTKYVKYPNIRLTEPSVTIDDLTFPPEQVKEFRLQFQKDTEACVKISDIGSAVDQGTRVFGASTSAYYLFSAKDPNNNITIDSLQGNLKNSLKFIEQQRKDMQTTAANKISAGTVNLTVNDTYFNTAISASSNFISDVSGEVVGYAKNAFSLNLATLGYVAKRLDLQEILFKKIFCYLKGADPNAEETAQLYSQLPYEVINYLKYIQNIQSLKGARYIRALEEGITFDALFCNDEVAYFIKGLTKLLNVTANGIGQTLTFIREIDASLKSLTTNRRVVNPYQAIVTSVSRTIYLAITDFLFKYIKDLLLEDCDETILEEDFDNFFDPFSTHIPVERYNTQENNNKQAIRKNRIDALGQTLPDIIRELTFGSDIEYTVDLIDLLLRDVNCILTATESVNLLKGSPSDEVIVLVRNIIRNKYNKDPNNLTYLLNDDKLKLFFKKLGLTVDQEYIIKYTDPVVELIRKQSADICTPEQFEARKTILANKIPVELGTLAADTRNRVQKARKLLERIQDGDVKYNISALCPEIDDADITNFKGNLFDEYISTIESIFSNTLNTFNTEVSAVANKFSEERTFTRYDSGNKPFETVPYYTYNSNLHENLFITDDPQINQGMNPAYADNFADDNTGVQSFCDTSKTTVVYKVRNKNVVTDSQLSDMFIKSGPAEIAKLDECSDEFAASELNPLFERMIAEGRVLFENDSERRNWNSIKKTHRERYYDYLDGKEHSDFLTELKQENSDLFDYIVDKKYVVFIGYSEDDQETKLRFVYYDPSIGLGGDFRLLGEKILPAEFGGNSVSYDLKYYTGATYIQYFEDEPIKFIEFHRKYFPTISAWYTKGDYNNSVYRIDKQFLSSRTKEIYILVAEINLADDITLQVERIASVRTFNYLQTSTISVVGNLLSSIDLYEKILSSKAALEDSGMFNIVTDYKQGKQIVSVAVTSETGSLDYESYYGNDPVINNITINTNVYNDIKDIETDYQDIILKPLYAAICDAIDETYLKSTYLEDEFVTKKIDDLEVEPEVGLLRIRDREYSMSRNPNFQNRWLDSYQSISLLNYSSRQEYANCNVYPHYLNLSYFLSQGKSDLAPKLCDTNLAEMPIELLNYVLTRLTIRSYISDQMLKIIAFLTLLDREDLVNLYKEQYVVDIMRNHMQSEMHIFTNTNGIKLDNERDYYRQFINKLVKDVYQKSVENDNISQKYVIDTSLVDNKEIDYYIRKEISHFINFCLDNGIIKPSGSSLYKKSTNDFLQYTYGYYPFQAVKGGGLQTAGDIKLTAKEDLTNFYKIPDFVKSEFYNAMLYFLMSNTVDYNKRNLLTGTKSELAKIFLSRMNESIEDENEKYSTKPQEDIVKFISKLVYTSNPAALAVLYPEYAKNITYYLEAAFEETRSILLNSSMFTDINVTLTRIINFGLSMTTSATWGLVDREKRQDLINDAAINNKALGLLYKRFDSAMSPLPDAAVGMGLWATTGLAPGSTGKWYYVFDTIKEGIWAVRTWKELDDIANSLSGDIDPCEVLPGDGVSKQEPICSLDKRNKLLEEVNVYEEGT